MDETKKFWEDLYGDSPRWSGKVNAPLAERVGDLPPGRALDLGCGEGGDALWLAERGWTVTAVDISTKALDRGRAEAARRGLVVDWREQDLGRELPDGAYDLVSAQFFQSPVELPREQVLRAAAAQVVPGGRLLVVGHAAGPPGSEHHDPALMPSAQTVWDDLALGAEWEPLEVADVARIATRPGGETVELLDSVVHAARR